MSKQVIALMTVWIFGTTGAFYAATPFQHSDQDVPHRSGAITGRVVNAEGRTVAGARVYAELVGFTVIGAIPNARTNRDGEFTIKNLAPGTYRLYGAKEEDGYAATNYSVTDFAADLPQASVFEDQVTRDAVVPLGPKLGRLVGHVRDVTTNELIENAWVVLRLVDNPERFTARTARDPQPPRLVGRFRFLAPPTPFTIEVSAPGYEDWHHGAIQVAPDATRELNIFLRPIERP